jgi:hypothetical protein
MRLLNEALRKLGVEPAERTLVLWAGASLFLLGAAGVAILNTAEALFLKRVGVESLPLALMASSGLLVLTTAAVGSLVARDPARRLPAVLAGLALIPVPFIVLANSHSPLIIAAFVLVARQLLAVGMLAFWLAMGSLVPTRRAKQLFAPLAAGVTIGGIVGSFGSGPLADWLGMGGLVALGVAVLGAAAFMSVWLRRCGTAQLGHAFDDRNNARVATESLNYWDLFRESRLFRLLGIALLCGGALSPILYFEFTAVLDAATEGPGGEQLLLALYSQFRGWVNVIMLVSQLWLSAGLYRRFGLPLTLALWPLAYVVGFIWVGVRFSFAPAAVSYGAARVSEDGISASAIRVLYNLFPDEIRTRASGFLEGPVNRFGGMLGNALVLFTISLGAATWVGWTALPIAILWLVSALVLWRAYPALLLRASAEHGLAGADEDRTVLLDPATLRSLAANLVDADPRVCRTAIELMVDGEPVVVVRLLAEALSGAPSASLPQLVAALQHLVESSPPQSARSQEATDAIEAALRDRSVLPANERAELLQVYARLTAGEDVAKAVTRTSMALLERALGDRAASVRLTAIVELHRRGAPPPGLPDLDRTLTQALEAPDALIRRAARRALRGMLVTSSPDGWWSERLDLLVKQLDQRTDRAETAEAMLDVARQHGSETAGAAKVALRWVEDHDPRVRGSLLALLGHAGLSGEGARLASALGTQADEELRGAREGLVALGSEAALPLLVSLEFGGASQRQAVLSILRDLQVDPDTLESLRARQLQGVREAVVQRACLEDLPGATAGLLRRRLEERVTEGLGALLDLLAAIYDDPRLTQLERRLRRAPTGRDRDLVVEAIESILPRADRVVIVPLLEPGNWPMRGEVAAAELGVRHREASDVLAELHTSADPTVRRIVAELPLESDDGIAHPRPMRSIMDIAVRLQDAPVFGQLSTQQIVALADLLQEQSLKQDERVFALGEEGVGLYLVLEGRVELRRGELLLDEIGPGGFFGELSALDGLPRSADAVASEDTAVLRLERDDLLSMVEEVPGLAIGLVQLLSARVRRLQERLDETGAQTGESP